MKSRGESLLEADEPPAFQVINAAGASSLVLLCDHADNRIPHRLHRLGLQSQQLEGHIAWDSGAAQVAKELSRLLDAPLVHSNYSRLVIDCNRPPDSPQSIPEESDGVVITGNLGLDPRDRAMRRKVLFDPYHQAIANLLDARPASSTALLSIHSFSPWLDGERRPWSIGVCYGEDRRLAEHWLDALSDCEEELGDNKPYSIEDGIDYTLPRHGSGRKLPHVMLEIRQDRIRDNASSISWALRLARAYTASKFRF